MFVVTWTLSLSTCHDCQQSTVQRHVKAPLKAFTSHDWRFDSVYVDIVGPLLPSKGYTCLFTSIDQYTRWSEAISMVDDIAESCFSSLPTTWVSRFGVPTTITSDQGQQFELQAPASQRTIHRQMVFSIGSTGFLKHLWKHVWQVVAGLMLTSLLFFLEFVQPSIKNCHVRQQKWFVTRSSVWRLPL